MQRHFLIIALITGSLATAGGALAQESKTNRSVGQQPSFNQATVVAGVRKIVIAQLGVKASQVNGDARIVEDLGADDLDCLELTMAFEQAFDIKLHSFVYGTVDNLAKMILKALDSQGRLLPAK